MPKHSIRMVLSFLNSHLYILMKISKIHNLFGIRVRGGGCTTVPSSPSIIASHEHAEVGGCSLPRHEIYCTFIRLTVTDEVVE